MECVTLKSERDLSQRRFGTILLLFKLTGIPLNTYSVSRVQSVHNITSAVCYYVTVASSFMDVYVNRNNFEEVMKSIRVFLAIIFVTVMDISFRFRKHDMNHLITLTEYFTWEELPAIHPDTGYATHAGLVPKIPVIVKYMMVFIAVFHGTQCIVRMIISHDMIYSKWYPFDATVSPVYELVNLSQAIASLCAACIFVGCFSLYAILVCVACSQLEKLRAALLDIRQIHVTAERDCGTQADLLEAQGHSRASEELFRHMQKQINNCIRHHQEIKRFMQSTEECWNILLCGTFLVLLSAMCFNAFSAIMCWGKHADVAQAVFLYAVMTGYVCLICWLGNELSEQAENVKDAAWGCDWVGTPVPFQRCLAFIIATANKEFTLTAGKFVPVSNKTMMNMMNQTLSFFMFLLQMRSRDYETN
ncbi:odorant receptor 2a [Cryptotermes secundus]|uniref:odorant receptor 2a n=1 Tax=Cryptotermes secundus TaxID=105785 RepID=UPI000CD7CD68|nr:odorant receptor 2a [Cryptotermes secundus]